MFTTYQHKCININLCLRSFKYIPEDIIAIITGLLWTMRSNPIILSFWSYNKIPQASIYSCWVYDKNIFKPHFDNIYSGFRYGKIRQKSLNEIECDIIYPKNVLIYLDESTKILSNSKKDMILVPGPLWDKACISDDVELIDGVQIFNYNSFNMSENSSQMNVFKNWLSGAIKDKSFLRVQNTI